MQHREWNPKTFFRKVSPETLALFAQERGIELPGSSSGEPDSAYRAWLQLPEKRRLALEADLLPVNDLCSVHARLYLDELARSIWQEDAKLLEATLDWSTHDLAVRLFTAAPTDVLRVHQAYALDMMEHFKEYRGKRPASIAATSTAKAQMKRAMAEHFRAHAGGARCQVEDFEGKDKFALYIYHEDEVTPFERFNDSDIVVPEWQRPVVHIAAVFYPDTRTLLVKAPCATEREKLRDLFAEIFVGDCDYFEDTSTTPKFDFDVLKREGFRFATHPADEIDQVAVTRLVIQSPTNSTKRLIFEFQGALTIEGVAFALEEHNVSLQEASIIGIKLQFRFAHGRGRNRFRTVSLFNPNSTNLRDIPRDRVIRKYLKEWGIDGSYGAFALAAPDIKAAANE